MRFDEQVAITRAQTDKEMFIRKLGQIFLEIDDSGNGLVTWNEFEHLITDDLLRAWLATLDVDTHDLGLLFHLLDKGSDVINVHEFIYGMSRVKGPAKSIDLLQLQAAHRELDGKLDTLLERFGQSRPSTEATAAASTAVLACKLDRLDASLQGLRDEVRTHRPLATERRPGLAEDATEACSPRHGSRCAL